MVQGEGECLGVEVVLQGVLIVKAFLPIPLGNLDLILGIQWLEKLGTTTTNWKTHTISFQKGGKTVTRSRAGISLKVVLHTIKKEKSGYMVEFNHLQREEKVLQRPCPVALQAVIS